MCRPAYGSLLSRQRAGCAASREKIFPTRLRSVFSIENLARELQNESRQHNRQQSKTKRREEEI